MTSDEALIEKMAEAIRALWKLDFLPSDHDIARAALSVVRENEKKGLVHADSTGAERSSANRSPEQIEEVVLAFAAKHRLTRHGMAELYELLALPREVAAQAETGKVLDGPHDFEATTLVRVRRLHVNEPTDDRSAPAAPREPNLPSSLLSRLDHQGGLTKGKRS